MNKLMGFYELKAMGLPAVDWKEYSDEESLDFSMLWTIRCAVHKGNDLNLPRLVGAESVEAVKFADSLKKNIGDNGIVIFYPYFIAVKSGTLNVFSDKVVIEAVKEDLWNLVTFSKRDVTIIIRDQNNEYYGNEEFLSEEELKKILKYVPEIRRCFKDELTCGFSAMLEWSFAHNCDIHKNKVGEQYLVFYEARIV
ncbi:MAG: hypothetical protein QM657_18695 [Lacrimispora sp.]|uniref:hypothetical protein n=1 Tax=Lacrimispora sp. TaxID=2719234 RepID=UPI0039E6E7BE